MKNTIRKYALWVIILVTLSAGVRSQGISGTGPLETLKVFTDRMMYISGEKISFSAIIITNNDFSVNNLSRVLYCELVTPDGTRISAGKYSIENGSALGSLAIPAEAISGYYYLKSYTKWMRNAGPESYQYLRIKIINPYKDEVLAGVMNLQAGNDYNHGEASSSLLISTDKPAYHPREEVELKITGYAQKDTAIKYNLTVVPLNSWDSISFHQNPGTVIPGSIQADPQYYPETRGISISGRLLEEKTGKPVPNALVNLSIIGDKDVMAIRTNSSGRFFFSLPGYSGNRDIFLCGEEITGISTSIFIDNDFCPEPLTLLSPAFKLTEDEKATAYAMAVNHQVDANFGEDAVILKDTGTRGESAFYGTPDEVLEMDRYIDLPTVEEYFSELLGSVNVRKFEGRTIFRFNSARTEMLIFDPLILIDMVAVNDISKILAMSPRLINRIELVNAPYIKGNITYGGIISFFSKNSDFAGIDLPSSGTFINFKFLEDVNCEIPESGLDKNMPDARNTVYWTPAGNLEEIGITWIRFTVPDTPGKYIIVLRGYDPAGVDYFIKKEIVVTDQ